MFPLERSPPSSLPPVEDPSLLLLPCLPTCSSTSEAPSSSSCHLPSKGLWDFNLFSFFSPSPPPPPSPRCCMRPPRASFASSPDSGPLQLHRRKQQSTEINEIKEYERGLCIKPSRKSPNVFWHFLSSKALCFTSTCLGMKLSL